jgi:hypothetical protein
MLRKRFDEGDSDGVKVLPIALRVTVIDSFRVRGKKAPPALSSPAGPNVGDDELREFEGNSPEELTAIQFAQCVSDLRNLRKLAA